MFTLLYKDEVYAIIGAAMEVHNVLGRGFQEAVYQEALEKELRSRNIEFLPQVELPIFYKGVKLDKLYVVDFLMNKKILVEIKALDKLTSKEESQLLNYLKASNLRLGLLINFGSESLEYKRMIN